MPAGEPLATPHYAVIFTSTRELKDGDGYDAMGERMFELASAQAGFLGFDAADTATPTKISSVFISYWKDEESILAWKRNTEHLLAQKKGREGWYSSYEIRVAKVERAYTFKSGE